MAVRRITHAKATGFMFALLVSGDSTEVRGGCKPEVGASPGQSHLISLGQDPEQVIVIPAGDEAFGFDADLLLGFRLQQV
jgi:hypothetical protein